MKEYIELLGFFYISSLVLKQFNNNNNNSHICIAPFPEMESDQRRFTEQKYKNTKNIELKICTTKLSLRWSNINLNKCQNCQT